MGMCSINVCKYGIKKIYSLSNFYYSISCAVTAFVKIIVFLVIIILRDPLNSAINFDRTL